MEQSADIRGAFLRYHLDNNEPIDLLDFTKSLQALQNEYATFVEARGHVPMKARLNIQRVEAGSVIIEIIESALPAAISAIGDFNTLVEFGLYLGEVIGALRRGGSVPANAYNHKSLENISTFIQPLASNPESTLKMEIHGTVNGNIYVGNCFDMNSVEGNAVQNRINTAKSQIDTEITKTEEAKSHVLLRLARLDRETESKHDRGIIEAFDPKATRKLLIDDEVKSWFMSSDENVFKNLYYVDATALYQEGRIKAYRITKVYERFLMED